MLNEVVDLSVEHVLMFVIIAFLLYHFIGGCSYGMRSRDGFSVGGENHAHDCNYYTSEEKCVNTNNYYNKKYPSECPEKCMKNPYSKDCGNCLWNPSCKWKSASNICVGPGTKNPIDSCNIEEHDDPAFPMGQSHPCYDNTDCKGYRTCFGKYSRNFAGISACYNIDAYNFSEGGSYCSCDIDPNDPKYTSYAIDSKCQCPNGYTKVDTRVVNNNGPLKGQKISRCISNSTKRKWECGSCPFSEAKCPPGCTAQMTSMCITGDKYECTCPYHIPLNYCVDT